MSRRVHALLVPLLALVTVALEVGPANGQVDTTTSSSSTSTTASSVPPTTRPGSATTSPPSTTAPGKGAKPTTTGPSTTTSTTVPSSMSKAAAAAAIAGLVRSGANSTAALLDALRVLETQGLSHEEAVKKGFGHFPVGGLATFRDDFGDFRAGPPVHTHQGCDILAAFDVPARAPYDGTVRFTDGGLAGKAATVTTSDGTYYFLAHLESFAPGVANGSRVAQGDTVGLVGDSGNAKGGTPHVHFEIHPGGGPAVNPKPILDGWIAEALAAVQPLLSEFVGDQPSVIQDVGLTRRFDVGQFDRRSQPAVEPLLWASSVSPPGSALRLAEVEAARVAGGIDWPQRAADARARAAAWRSADDRAGAYLGPLTPPALDTVMAAHPD